MEQLWICIGLFKIIAYLQDLFEVMENGGDCDVDLLLNTRY